MLDAVEELCLSLTDVTGELVECFSPAEDTLAIEFRDIDVEDVDDTKR